jgi:hypothetical protein
VGGSISERRASRAWPHRGDVADVDGERLVADIGRCRERPVEMHALHQHVGRQHLERPAIHGSHGGIVADADEEDAGAGGAGAGFVR